MFIGNLKSVEELFCPQLKDKLVKLFYQNFLLLWKSFEVCVHIYMSVFKHICIYILVLFPIFSSERTDSSLMNATVVVYIKILYLLFILIFKRAVDAKIITNQYSAPNAFNFLTVVFSNIICVWSYLQTNDSLL